MSRDLERETVQWLAAEAADDAESAERALRRAFLQLPAPPLPEGFTDQGFTETVMARVAEELSRDPFSRRRVRAAIAAIFLMAAGLLLVVGQALRVAMAQIHPLEILRSLSPATDASAGGLMSELATLSRVTAGLLTTPPVIFAVIALTLLCAGAFRLLKDISKTRESSHVDAT